MLVQFRIPLLIRKFKSYSVIIRETYAKEISLITYKLYENVITLPITHKGKGNFMSGDYNHSLNDVELLDDVIKRNFRGRDSL